MADAIGALLQYQFIPTHWSIIMNNVLKNTLIYSGLYFIYCMFVMLVAVTVQIFWKPVVFMFFIILALLTLDHYSKYNNVFSTPAQLWTQIRAKFA
jgi:hypothetical protein